MKLLPLDMLRTAVIPVHTSTGMSLRDYFAAHALPITNPLFCYSDRAKEAYEIADQLIAARDNTSYDSMQP